MKLWASRLRCDDSYDHIHLYEDDHINLYEDDRIHMITPIYMKMIMSLLD
jgi:hypothetical protein